MRALRREHRGDAGAIGEVTRRAGEQVYRSAIAGEANTAAIARAGEDLETAGRVGAGRERFVARLAQAITTGISGVAQRAPRGSARGRPGRRPPPLVGGASAPPAEPPLDVADEPFAGPPPAPSGGAIGAAGPASELAPELVGAPATPAPLEGPATPFGSMPPSTRSTPSAAGPSVPLGAPELGSPLAQPGSSQSSEASWIPSSELHADAPSRSKTHLPGLAATRRRDAPKRRLCSGILLIVGQRCGSEKRQVLASYVMQACLLQAWRATTPAALAAVSLARARGSAAARQTRLARPSPLLADMRATVPHVESLLR